MKTFEAMCIIKDNPHKFMVPKDGIDSIAYDDNVFMWVQSDVPVITVCLSREWSIEEKLPTNIIFESALAELIRLGKNYIAVPVSENACWSFYYDANNCFLFKDNKTMYVSNLMVKTLWNIEKRS